MAVKSPLRLKDHLFVLIHGGSGVPYALRLNLRRISGFVLLASFAFLTASTGTLLFFRELEINRKLGDRLLEYETKEKLAAVGFSPMRPTPVPNTVSGAPISAIPAPVANVDRATTAVPPPVTVASTVPSALPTEAVPVANAVRARVGELTADCLEEECEVILSMVPTQPGVAQGELLLVLETEIPRIGTGNPTTQIRKRFFIYPGAQTRDDLSQELLSDLQRKPFRFTRALRTTATFTTGKLLRPLAINVYLFDKDRTLIHHERKAIESEE